MCFVSLYGRIQSGETRLSGGINGHFHHRDWKQEHNNVEPHAANEKQRDNLQHRSLRQRNRHGWVGESARSLKTSD